MTVAANVISIRLAQHIPDDEFDYSALPEGTADILRQKANSIRRRNIGAHGDHRHRRRPH